MIHTLIGDATAPDAPGTRIIVHICNDIGRWGKGFVLALSRRWPEPETSYRAWHASDTPQELGMVQPVRVAPDTIVINMIAQQGIRARNGVPPIRYAALETCLAKVALYAADFPEVSIHMPRIGCGLAGGEWAEVQRIIERALGDLPVFVYVLR